jgi:Tol biopolymer transport system component
MSRWYGGWREAEMRSKLPLIALAVALAVLGSALPAAAGDRPVNGRITFGRFDPALGDFSIWAANPDGTHQRRLTHVPSFFSDWSPDGRRIAFDFADDSGVHIATMDPNGRHVRQLTFGQGIQKVPKWSPDGRWITFNASTDFPDEPGFHTDIWIMRADGSHARQLTSGGFDVEPVFSPDGRWITFNIEPPAPNAGIMAVHPNGKGLRVIRRSDNRFQLFKAVWSPDGRKFLVGCLDVQAQIDKLCVMKANGHDLHVVVATPDPLNFPAWGTHPPKR